MIKTGVLSCDTPQNQKINTPNVKSVRTFDLFTLAPFISNVF